VLDRAAAKAPAVTALQALEANARLVELLSTRRWYIMQAAREQGAQWRQAPRGAGR
jgi:hypothetical protein